MGSVITVLIAVAVVIISIKNIRDQAFTYKWMLIPQRIIDQKEYYRLFTSGLIHNDYRHLAVNMITFWFFGEAIESYYGSGFLLALFVISLVGANLLTVALNRNKENYQALGASGAVSGVVFSLLYMHPMMEINLFFILPMKAWWFVLFWIGYTIYGMIKDDYKVGHDAHLGGSLVGCLVTLLIYPEHVKENWWILLLIVIPATLAIGYKWLYMKGKLKKPDFIRTGQKKTYSGRKEYVSRRERLDAILDKIAENGVDSLTDEEREFLQFMSDKE